MRLINIEMDQNDHRIMEMVNLPCAQQLKKVCMYKQMYKTSQPLCRWMTSGCTRVISIRLEGSRTPAGEIQEALSSLKGMGKWNWLGFLRWHSFKAQNLCLGDILVHAYFMVPSPIQTIRRYKYNEN